MNHTAVTQGSNFVHKAIKYLNNTGEHIPLVLGEVDNTLENRSVGTSLNGVLGSALWQVDFSLYSMFIGVAGINMQSGVSFPFSLWHPKINDTPGEVLPAFYGQIFAAEFIGVHDNVRLANIDLNSPFLSAYATYEDGALTARVEKLTSPDGGTALASDNITWAGMQWTYENNGTGVSVLNDTQVLQVQNGAIDLKVNASEAVMVFLQR
ncbi:glycoside hydrolase family 79 protein [Glonium stellatum]|uniref:Glycoside hydrolase family 79 protein n=1 Tax=Glonium stellatum TaxID=574774 RepID=A0A8E2EUU8_9PEZI|nr:glycoside hydrolase family 79 protein [Glonium stellatum]